MAENPEFPISRWPYEPCWEVGGFDFSVIPVALFRNAIEALHIQRFTKRISNKIYPSDADYSRMVANNVAAQFRAMLYCKDYYPSETFWRRVQECSLRKGHKRAKAIGDLFIRARKAYLRSTGGCPNDAARVVDEWITFQESSVSEATGPSVKITSHLAMLEWRLCMHTWHASVKRGELTDCGQSLSLQANTTAKTPAGDATMRQQSVEDASTSPDGPDGVAAKKEDVSDDASAVDSEYVAPISKRKRNQNECPTASHPRPSKRCANEFYQVEGIEDDIIDDMFDSLLQFPEPPSCSVQGRHTDDPALEVPAEHENIPAHEQDEALPTSRKGVGHRKSTKARLTKCEETLAKHLNMIDVQGSKLAAQEELVAEHAAKLESLEQNLSADKEIEAIRKSLDELMERQNNRITYIRAEVKKRWNDVRSPLEQAQGRTDSCLDTLRDELAIHKTRLEDCQKAFNHNKQERDISQLETSLKTKVRIQRKRVDELCNRVAELEENLNDGKTSPVPDDDGMDEKSLLRVEAQLTDLAKRIDGLEKKHETQRRTQQSAMGTVNRRLDALESSNPQKASTLEAGRAPLGRQATEQEARYAQQEWAGEPSKIENARFARHATAQETRCASQATEHDTRFLRHATEQETRFARYERVAEPSRIEIANSRDQVWNSGAYTAPALGPAHVPAHPPAHTGHVYQHPSQHHGHHQGTQRQASQGYYRAATRER